MAASGGLARDGWYTIGIGKEGRTRRRAGDGEGRRLHGDGRGVERRQRAARLHVADHRAGTGALRAPGLFRIPARLVEAVQADMLVPVKVKPGDPKKVAIDWDA